MKVSVIIPAFNEEDVIEGCLRSLAAQTHDNFEVIFVDDQSTDSTKRILDDFCARHSSRFRVKTYGKVGPGRARNLAARETNAEILAFMDADCEASPDWISRLASVYQNLPATSVGGPQLAHPSSTPFQKMVDAFFRRFSGLSDFYKMNEQNRPFETAHNPLCNTSYRREAYSMANGFREDLFPGEDWDLDFRLRRQGHQIYFHPEAVVFHHRPETIQQFRRVLFAYGRAQGKMVRDYGSHRGIHVLGVSVLSLIILSLGFFGWRAATQSDYVPLALTLIFTSLLFFFRPASQSFWSLCMNACSWFSGFAIGFLTNRSPPPGAKTPLMPAP